MGFKIFFCCFLFLFKSSSLVFAPYKFGYRLYMCRGCQAGWQKVACAVFIPVHPEFLFFFFFFFFFFLVWQISCRGCDSC